MRIDRLIIENFRSFERMELDLHPQFNLLIGENGSGKTAVLEALAVAMSGFLAGLDGVPANYLRPIRDEDIRIIQKGGTVYSFPTIIKASGTFPNFKDDDSTQVSLFPHDEELNRSWERIRRSKSGRTQNGNHNPIMEYARYLNEEHKKTDTTVEFPVLAYYSTGRLWLEGQKTKEKKNTDYFAAYQNALGARNYVKQVMEWLKAEYAMMIKKGGQKSVRLLGIEQVILNASEDFADIDWEFDSTVKESLFITFTDGKRLPFSYLSDGYRNILAMFADIAWRCIRLNPHLGEAGPGQTRGIVLIDELDLHLHPKWQRQIIGQLTAAFPHIQFVATTHSPFLIQQTSEGQLIKLCNNQVDDYSGGEQLSFEEVVSDLQGVSELHWSVRKKEMHAAARKYFDLLRQLTPDKSDAEIQRIFNQLDELPKPYLENPAFVAFLEQKRYMAEERLKSQHLTVHEVS